MVFWDCVTILPNKLLTCGFGIHWWSLPKSVTTSWFKNGDPVLLSLVHFISCHFSVKKHFLSSNPFFEYHRGSWNSFVIQLVNSLSSFFSILRLSQIGPVGVPSSWLLCLFDMLPFVFEYFLAFWDNKMSRLILYLPCLRLGIQGALVSCSYKMAFRNQDPGTRYVLSSWGLCFWPTGSWLEVALGILWKDFCLGTRSINSVDGGEDSHICNF